MPDSGSDGRDRLSRDQIPEDLTCQLCPERPIFKKVSGYTGHMLGKHQIYFEHGERPEWLTGLAKAEVPQEPAELPVWVKVALVKHELYGESWASIAQQTGKATDTLSKWAKTPAAKKAREQMKEMYDMKALIKVFMESATAHMYADWLAALEWAKDARDYKMVHTMIKDIGLQPILQEAKQQNVMPTTLILNLGGGDLKQVEAKTSYVVDAIVEPDDGD